MNYYRERFRKLTFRGLALSQTKLHHLAFLYSVLHCLVRYSLSDRQRKTKFLADIDRIKRKYGLQLQDAGTLDEDLDLSEKLSKPKNLGRRPWYKCIEGALNFSNDLFPLTRQCPAGSVV